MINQGSWEWLAIDPFQVVYISSNIFPEKKRKNRLQILAYLPYQLVIAGFLNHQIQYLKSTWHSPYILVYIDPLLTYLLVFVPSILTSGYRNAWGFTRSWIHSSRSCQWTSSFWGRDGTNNGDVCWIFVVSRLVRKNGSFVFFEERVNRRMFFEMTNFNG